MIRTTSVALGAIAVAAALATTPDLARAQAGSTYTVAASPALAEGKAPILDTTVPFDPVLTAQAPVQSSDPITEYFVHWFDRVDKTQAEQPHWMTPVVTVTPRLEEEFRYDQYWEKLGNGATVSNYGAGKGLEFIPAEPVEVIMTAPPFEQKAIPGKPSVTGWGDWPGVLVKLRLLTANEQNGNYILTAFLQAGAPTGIAAFTTNTGMITPTLAGGIGFGDFDIQSTIGESFPFDSSQNTGNIISWNTTFQYHLWNVVWPELEVNDTRWAGGERGGINQVFLTPGVIFGRFPLVNRIKLNIGFGYQIAVAPQTIREPLTPLYRNNFILTTRFTF